jgi:hypothetical protein
VSLTDPVDDDFANRWVAPRVYLVEFTPAVRRRQEVAVIAVGANFPKL